MKINGHFHCSAGGADHSADLSDHRCPVCRSPLDFVLDRPCAFPRQAISRRPPSLWRYAEALPSFPEPVSLGEPTTPLLPFAQAGTAALAKCEYTLPSGSYKDRGSALLMSCLRALGVEEAVEDSSGNAGASLAAYAARAGIRLKVFCPASASAGKLAQIRLHGAELIRVEGPRPRATEALLAYVERTGAIYASHLWHPLFIEGVKSLAFEIAEQLDWTLPDAVLCPVGAGSILLGLYRGFCELRAAGIADRLPPLVAIQSARVSPIDRAFRAGADHIAPATDARPTLAEGIALPGPVRDRQVLTALRESGGAVVTVTEEEIADGIAQLGRCGFCVEPTSAVVWHGLRKYRRESGLSTGARPVVILSGHGLKATAQLDSILP